MFKHVFYFKWYLACKHVNLACFKSGGLQGNQKIQCIPSCNLGIKYMIATKPGILNKNH